MLNNNFKNWLVEQLYQTQVTQKFKKIDGTETNTTLYAFSSLFKANTAKINNITASGFTFALGSGTTPATKEDYFVETQIDNDEHFSIAAASIVNNANQGKVICQQVWNYSNSENPTQEVTINEIGFCVCNGSGSQRYMMAREVLESPITVKDGDTFSVAITIGG